VLEDHIFTNHDDKAHLVDQHYDELLGTCLEREYTINLSDFELPFTEEEVWMTIKKLPFDKAPGLDGFMRRFCKTCWPITKQDIMTANSVVWSRKMMGFSALNTAYITLLPKKDKPSNQKISGR
jgi:hypothetical protein